MTATATTPAPSGGRDSSRPLLHVGWRELHPDVSLNFQLNRWAAYGGERWLADVRPVLPRLTSYPAWKDSFVTLGERATSEGRVLDAALHLRCAEFFMTPDDARKAPLRARLLTMFREAAAVPLDARREVTFEKVRLPAWHFVPARSRGTFVVYGGFDAYIEEFFPALVRMRDGGWTVVAFEGPGQGAVLEDQGIPMTPDWHEPVRAILDAFDLDDVTLLGVSLGGCLVIRAAAFEPRVKRVVAFDILTDFFACMTKQVPKPLAALARGAIDVGLDGPLDAALARVMRRRPVVEWGISQAMRVFGSQRPAAALAASRRFHTRDVSKLVTQDVLLMAGAEDHYVPVEQLWEQARLLSRARSVTTRLFTREEYAHERTASSGTCRWRLTSSRTGQTSAQDRAENRDRGRTGSWWFENEAMVSAESIAKTGR
jgi:pimeloyl-ACP methyl ester carboxylesterase